MDAKRKERAEAAFRAAADPAAALEARLGAEEREQYRVLREKQEAELRRAAERRDKARAAYEAEKKKHQVDLTLDLVRRSATTPVELR